jgi:FtsP/CotA-like multicopper oxidase with cupredoxin domain
MIRGTKTLSLRAFALGTAAASALLMAGTASAQPGQEPKEPPRLKQRGANPSHPFAPTGNKEVLLDLNIEYVDGVIYNPKTGRDDKVRLRAYTQDGLPQPERFVSPSIVARPGDTVRVKLNNKLPPVTLPAYDTGCAGGPNQDHNVPHCFNGTNLHTHGLWVNPSGNGDNVLLSINPGVKFEYEYAIDPEHPAGTFWYHTHRHGSTALQVSSGMAGALIIKGDKAPTPTKNGDLDVLIDGVRGIKDRTLVLQQIHYACLDQNQDIKTTNAPNGAVTAWVCDPDDVGGVEVYKDKKGNGFGNFTGWGQSKRYTSINGYVLPTFNVKQNQVERWRLIHGGVRDTVRVLFVKANSPSVDTRPGDHLATDNMEAFVQANCSFQTVPFHVVAADGLTLKQAIGTRNVTMQPGYRWDLLVNFPQEGEYCMLDILSQSSESVGNVPSGVRLLGIVKVEGDQDQVNRGTTVEQLVDSARKSMPADVRDQVIADLNNGVRLSRFAPHESIDPSELTGGQEMTFDITSTGPTTNLFQVANQLPTSPNYNPQAYDPARLDRKLTLGAAEEWKLTSNRAGHPFHIHVNPFEIVKIVRDSNPTVDVSAPGAFDGGDPQYPGLRGMWKDTLWVKPGYTLTMRTRYKRYIGEFVLHCHILDHEDEGMMQNVAVVLPGGNAASVNAPPVGHSTSH